MYYDPQTRILMHLCGLLHSQDQGLRSGLGWIEYVGLGVLPDIRRGSLHVTRACL